MKYRSCWHIFTLRSKFGSHCLTIWKYDTHALNGLGDIRQNHWTIKYRSNRPTFILESNIGSYWPIIPKYDVHTSNSLQDVTQNHWTMKYRSLWPYLYWLIIPINDVYTSNRLQNIRQNHSTMKYRSQWPTFILRSNVVSYWLIIPNYDVHTSNSLQDIRQNQWTMKYRSCWPSLHDLHVQVNVTGLRHVWPTICVSRFYNKTGVLDFDHQPHPGHDPWDQNSWQGSRPSKVLMVQISMFSDEWFVRYTALEKLPRNSVENFVVYSKYVTDAWTHERMNRKVKTICINAGGIIILRIC